MKQFKFLLIGAIASLFIGGVYLSSTTKVEAQLRGFGSACVSNNADCGPGKVNLQDLINENKVEYKHDMHFEALVDSILSSHPGTSDIGEVCIPDTYLDASGNLIIFPVNRAGSGSLSPNSEDSSVTDNDALADVVPRACGGDRVISESSGYIYNRYPEYAALCCPLGYKAVGQSESISEYRADNMTHDAACCLIPDDPTNNNTPSFFVESGGVINCFNATNLTDAKPLNYSSRQSSIQKGIRDDAARGLPLGSPVTVSIRTGSSLKCKNNDGCAIVPAATSLPAGGMVTQITSEGSDVGIVDSDAFIANAGAQCNQCFDTGEAMIIEDPIGADPSKLIVCAGDGTITKRNLVNNNIADTLAVLEAEKNGDPTNAAFIANCRAQGGLPTAIGCIDTTPVGIITNLIRIALGTMGGVALLQLILVGLRYMQGDEGEIKKAREQLVATLTGLATLVFSVLILRILGVNILDIIPSGTI